MCKFCEKTDYFTSNEFRGENGLNPFCDMRIYVDDPDEPCIEAEYGILPQDGFANDECRNWTDSLKINFCPICGKQLNPHYKNGVKLDLPFGIGDKVYVFTRDGDHNVYQASIINIDVTVDNKHIYVRYFVEYPETHNREGMLINPHIFFEEEVFGLKEAAIRYKEEWLNEKR